MPEFKPYIDYMFLGMSSFIDKLTEAGTPFEIIDDSAIELLFVEKDFIFTKGTDTIVLGLASRDEKKFYFVEFGIRIDSGVLSYVVFLYKNYPSTEDIKISANDIEVLTKEYFDNLKNATKH